ncbi:hypothetical protein EYF80_046448 [Liparis tanakae]|uniref:Uncharacterized protein n=1 Tax=Liparis tanakae TaxID=230148 RepID=A0A4Z2FR79_9TELE|nr:hypothetical protein EYF80_046448 [Liparis tanakae]
MGHQHGFTGGGGGGGLPRLPALSQRRRIVGSGPIGLPEVVVSKVVKVSAQAADFIRVSGRQDDVDGAGVVVGDREAEAGRQVDGGGVALDADGSIAERQRKLPPDPGNSVAPHFNDDLLHGGQRGVPVLLVDHLHAEHGHGLGGGAGLSQRVGAGRHKAEHLSIKRAAVGVAVYGAGPRGSGPTGSSHVRTADSALRALGGGAGELPPGTEAAAGPIGPQLALRVTLGSCGDRNKHNGLVITD